MSTIEYISPGVLSRIVRAFVVACSIVLLCGTVSPLHAGPPTGTLTGVSQLPVIRVALFERISSPDPAQSGMYEPHNIASNVFETLVTSDSSGSIMPGIATSWSASPDGIRWTFFIPEGRSFHDASPLDAYAVEFCFQRLINPAHQLFRPYPDWKTQLFSHVNSIRALDAQTLQIDLDKPYAPLLHNLSTAAASIISPLSLQKYYDGESRILAGSGSFKFAEFKTESVLLQPSEYLPAAPQVQVRFDYYRSEAVLSAYQQNKVDIITGLDQSDETHLLSENTATLLRHPQLSVLFLYCNGARQNIRNIAVRRAISLSINRSQISGKAIGKNSVPAKGFLPPGLWATEPSLPPFEYNPKLAKDILAKAGLKDGIDLTVIQLAAPRPFLPAPKRLASALKNSLLQAGIRLEFEFLDGEQFLTRMQNQDFDIAVYGWVSDTNDPDNLLSTHLYAGKENPHQRIAIDKLDQLILYGQSEQSLKKRMQYYSTAQYIIHKELPCIPMLHSKLPVIIRNTIKGVRISPVSFLVFRNATVQPPPLQQ
ncbi:ABC transporter substrate-binding protein [Oleidesulfovibrio sp.]|uniref:ABC transporter substrate-binding protein n=1 Tax=Oleidesulfovibrio sp. TaxID=2909707 RepID=UPI003A85B5F9